MVLASNFKGNMDDAFIRRFHEVIHFPLPDAQDRKTLWEKALPSGIPLDPEINLGSIANSYELTGASILNVIQYATLRAYGYQEPKTRSLLWFDILEGIKREYRKEDRSI